jgi:hypothetical protein
MNLDNDLELLNIYYSCFTDNKLFIKKLINRAKLSRTFYWFLFYCAKHSICIFIIEENIVYLKEYQDIKKECLNIKNYINSEDINNLIDYLDILDIADKKYENFGLMLW